MLSENSRLHRINRFGLVNCIGCGGQWAKMNRRAVWREYLCASCAQRYKADMARGRNPFPWLQDPRLAAEEAEIIQEHGPTAAQLECVSRGSRCGGLFPCPYSHIYLESLRECQVKYTQWVMAQLGPMWRIGG